MCLNMCFGVLCVLDMLDVIIVLLIGFMVRMLIMWNYLKWVIFLFDWFLNFCFWCYCVVGKLSKYSVCLNKLR